MASPIRSGKAWNAVGYRASADLDLASGGVVTGSNTNRVFRANGDGTWSSYRPSRSINAFTTMTRARAGSQEDASIGSGNVYLLDAIQSFNVSEQVPVATVAEGTGMTPSENADDVTYIHTISGFDRIPNYALHSGTVVNSNGTGGGNWSSGATWSGGSAPPAGAIVRIRRGDTVTVDGVISTEFLVVSVENGATLRHSVAANTELHTQTLQVRETGVYEMGTPGSPVPNGTTCKLVINDASVDTTFDPNQWGNGLVVLGTFTACGYDRGASFVRLASEVASTGATSVTLSEAVPNWQVGDRVAIPDTRQLSEAERTTFTPQWEVRTIASLTSGNTVVTFDSPLTYAHKGARASAGGAVEYAPHLLNLTRNVVIQSESASGTRGHCVFTGMARIDVRNTLFKDLSRTTTSDLDNTAFDGGGTPTHVGTNQIGKYPAHFHHCGGREAISYGGESWQGLFLNNAVDGGDSAHSRKWGVTVHGTHWVLVRNTALYNTAGGGIVLEDGSETGNWIDANFCLRVVGNAAREDADDATKGFARNGAPYWCRSGLSRWTSNFAANFDGYGLTLNAIFLGTITVPAYPGAHLHGGSVTGGVSANGYRLGVHEFDGLECYGGKMQAAVTFWWLNTSSADPELSAHRSVLANVTCWHSWGYAVYTYENCHTTLKDWVVRGDWDRLAAGDSTHFVWPSDYLMCQFRVEGADVRGVNVGMEFSPFTSDNAVLKDSRVEAVRSVVVNYCGMPSTAAFSAALQWPRTIWVEGCDLTPVTTTVSGSPAKWEIDHNTDYAFANYINLVVRNDAYVINRNGGGLNYRLYSLRSEASDTLAQTSTDVYIGCAESGLTNQQAHDKYEPWAPTDGYAGPAVKIDAPNAATPGLCYGGAIAPAGVTTPAWTNALVEFL